MNRCFDGMVEAVKRYDGTVDKFIGDAIMVLFGAPRAHEDDSERAVRCAMDMQRYLAEVNKTLKQPLKMRIGINTGEVVAGGVGGQDRMDYTVMGDVVNTAQRIESAASPGSILVSAAVKRLTDRVVSYRPLPPVTVKGKAEPVAVFEVEGLAEAKTALDPLCGRRDEVGRLHALMKQVKANKPGGVVFLGEGGMGKTRLLDEARRLALDTGLKVGVARARRMGAPAELELLREVLFSLVGGLPAGPADADRKLAELQSLGASKSDVARLSHLFGNAAPPAGFDREEARKLDQACVLQALLDIARAAGGLCLTLDDVHLSDVSSLEYLDELVGRSAGTPLALVATARPGDAQKLLKRVPRFELKGLEAPDIRQLARHQLGGAEVPEVVADRLVARSDGNPFIAREILRTLMEAGVLELRGGVWTTAPTLYTFSLPDSVGQLVAARVDQLSAPARQLLRYGAVHGRVFPTELISHAMEGSSVDANAALTECVNRGFLQNVEQPSGCVQFRQEIVLQTVLKGIGESDLKYIHSRLAEALEQGLSSGDAHPSEAMARHFLGAGRARKAATYYSVSAERLASKSAFVAAVDAYQKAIKLLQEEIARTPGNHEAAWDQVLALACKLAPIQGVMAPPDALSMLEDVIKKCPPNLDAKARAEALRHRGLLELKLSRANDADASLTEALALYGVQSTGEGRAALEADLAAVREARGDNAGATHLLLEALKRIAGGVKLSDRDLLWRLLNQLGRVHLRIGEIVKAREFFENARVQAQKIRSPVGEVKALTNLAGALGTAGDTTGAAQTLDAALQLANNLGDRVDVARIEYNLGRIAIAAGRREEAELRLNSALLLANLVSWREGIAAATAALESLKAQGAKSPQAQANRN
jgi:serine/threonine-protein kinase